VQTNFFPFTTSDNLWYKWELVKQTQNGRGQSIIELIIKLKDLYSSLLRNMLLDFPMEQQFLNAMYTYPMEAFQPQIMPEYTLDTILTIAEKHDVHNHATGVYRHLGNEQIASNIGVQA
jgi:hypothetical protein